MSDQDIQDRIDKANVLLNEARSLYDVSKYDESERCANDVLELLERYTERDELGEERDSNSQKYAIIEAVSQAYSRLQTISSVRSDYALSLSQAEIALGFCERNGNRNRKAGLLINVGSLYSTLSDSTKALDYLHKGLVLGEEFGDNIRIAHALGAIGSQHVILADYAKALEYLHRALVLFEELNLKDGISLTLGRIGLVYWHLSHYTNALDYLQRALAICEEIGNKAVIANILLNIGNVYGSLTDYSKALECYQKALAINEEIGNKEEGARALGNIGTVYAHHGDYANALESMSMALAIFEELGNKAGIVNNLDNIGSTYAKPDFGGYDPVKAEEYLLRAIAVGEEIGQKYSLFEIHKNLADLYKREERWRDFAHHFEKYYTVKDEVQSEEARKQANLMEQSKQAAERDKLLEMERIHAKATQTILHQVLPVSIADRLVQGEKVADYFDRVSILFADIVGFTPIASRMPAKIVLAFLNHVFDTFDSIIERNGCEKIKTIGDGYLAVAGAPVVCDDHAERIALAALELMNDIHLPDEIRKHLPKGLQFSIRIGIHTGPAFAGIVGAKRFVYDIYSDAVNIAARMESQGEPGRIHVSEDFAHHLQNRTERFVFEERDEIAIKGKGSMRTYFLEKA